MSAAQELSVAHAEQQMTRAFLAHHKLESDVHTGYEASVTVHGNGGLLDEAQSDVDGMPTDDAHPGAETDVAQPLEQGGPDDVQAKECSAVTGQASATTQPEGETLVWSQASVEDSVWPRRYDWSSVDCYHGNAPDYDALGRFEDRWYVCHNYFETGREIASLQAGDLGCVDGALVQVSWMYYGPIGMRYSEARSVVGNDSVCFQTCVGQAEGICVAVCYPA